MVTSIILFACVAAFLALRLYAVLGKRTGHEQPLPKAAEDRAPIPPMRQALEAVPEVREPGSRNIDQGAEAGLRSVIAADSSFDVAQFLEGSKAAYRMILEAYWKGDEETLGWLVDDEVREGFSAAIAERAAAGHVLENRLVSIERAAIVAAAVENRVARIAVRFDADIASVTRDSEGNVIAGSLTDAVETHEVWTFARSLRSDDPNWKLVETDDA
jgi:predicted lipid-binding transport protein (Tim44 family)